jgi:hypothetical protein
MDKLKNKWGHLYTFGYPQRPFPTNYENDLNNIKIGLYEGTKWQQEQDKHKYSEEDMRNAFDSAREFNSLDGVVDVHIVLPMGGDMSDLQPLHFTFDEWFKQFKKK